MFWRFSGCKRPRACAGAEAHALASFSTDEARVLRRVLTDVIGANVDPASCR
jgi:hypothetical protein